MVYQSIPVSVGNVKPLAPLSPSPVHALPRFCFYFVINIGILQCKHVSAREKSPVAKANSVTSSYQSECRKTNSLSCTELIRKLINSHTVAIFGKISNYSSVWPLVRDTVIALNNR